MNHKTPSILLASLLMAFIGIGTPRYLRQQQNYDPPRPMLDFSCRDYSLPYTPSVTLIGEVLGVKELLGAKWFRALKYHWRASEGEILGHGRSKVVWEAPKGQYPSEVRITLEIEGAPPDIEPSKSCILRFESSCVESRVAEYGDDIRTEQIALDTAAARFQLSDKASVLNVIVYAGADSCIWEAEWRGKRAKRYLVSKYRFDEQRIRYIDGGFRESPLVELIITPTATCGPVAKPTLLRSEVSVGGQCSNKYQDLH